MKKWQKSIIVLIVAILLEIGWFNFEPILLRLTPSIQTDVVEHLENMTLVNYTQVTDGTYRSDANSQIFMTAPTNVRNVSIRLVTEPQPAGCIIFYDDQSGVLQAVAATPDENGQMTAKLRVDEGKLLRVDVGDNEGIILSEAEIVFNSSAIHFSLARVIAMLVVWFGASFLFNLQKMPDYKKYM